MTIKQLDARLDVDVMLKKLPKRTQQILFAQMHNKTLKEIAKKHKLSIEGVRKIIYTAKKKIFLENLDYSFDF